MSQPEDLREALAQAVHESWHDPDKPGYGIPLPEDYVSADGWVLPDDVEVV